MKHPEPDTLLALALDTLPERDREALLLHIRRCASCQSLCREHLEALTQLVELHGPLPPPTQWETELRSRLKRPPSTISSPIRRSLLWAALGIALALLGMEGYRRYQDRLTWQRFLTLVSEPGARMMPLIDPSGRQTGWALRTAQGGVLLYLQTPPPPGRVYQAWLILPQGRKSLGLSPTRLLEITPPPPEGSRIGVSVEPPGGSPSPTTLSVGQARL